MDLDILNPCDAIPALPPPASRSIRDFQWTSGTAYIVSTTGVRDTSPSVSSVFHACVTQS